MLKRIGVLTSGGDSSGMNAAIRGVVRGAIYHKLKVFGIYQGFEGLIKGEIKELSSRDVGGIINHGGTILYTARSNKFLKKKGREAAYKNYLKHNLDALIVIGGNGSLSGLLEFSRETGIVGVGLPGTIDNDLFGTDYTIGFDTAINVAVEAIDRIRDTATSHERLFLIEVMGRHAGYIATYSALAGGAEDVLIPETTTNIKNLCDKLESGKRKGKKSSIVIVAEGETAGNVVSIAKEIKKNTDWDVRLSILGHIQRGGTPTAMERINASRLGVASVEALLNGKKGVMLGIINDKISFTPLADAISKKKPINPHYFKVSDILASV